MRANHVFWRLILFYTLTCCSCCNLRCCGFLLLPLIPSIVFANLPQYLSNALENIQKSALGIIVPSMPYSHALHLTGLPSLQERRESACIRFLSKISPDNPLYSLILSRSQPRESPYNLRRNTNIVTKQTNTDRFARFVTCKYATYLDS